MLRMLVLIVAISSGGAAAWLATQGPAPQMPVSSGDAAEAPMETTEVLVAAADIQRGAEIPAEALAWERWPRETVGTDLFARDAGATPSALAGQFAARPIAAGEPLRRSAVAPDRNGYLAAMLTPGKRAVAIRTSAETTAGGFILPNDRVDVLHTYEVTTPMGATEVVTRTILRDLRVLAIDQVTEDAETESVLGKTATLELGRAEAETVKAAEVTGVLSLTLRPFGMSAEEEPVAEDAAPKTIRINRGGEIEIVRIN